MANQLQIKTGADLTRIKDEYQTKLAKFKYQILLCSGAGCVSSNCQAIKDSLQKSLNDCKLTEKVLINETGCIGTCDLGPVLIVMPEQVLYTKLKPTDIPAIVYTHLLSDKIKIENTYFDRHTNQHISHVNDIPYFKDQIKIALRNCGVIDHASLESYIAQNGYLAAAKVLQDMTGEAVVTEIKKSGLRGRGGAGFPTGLKWEAGLNALGKVKYLICNADEGDPGAFMDRSILEGDPHSVIEGMIIAGYAIGAVKGFIYVRAEYPLAVERLGEAIKKARCAGLLGNNILGSSFNFDLEIRIGAGAFVCGEETALISSIEGERGEPRQKPPLPFQKGLFEKPTIINNVETFANVPAIILNGAQWYAGFGTSDSKGTKVFALAGTYATLA
jgi:(2Fe-2S) ferredoxin